MKSCIMWVWMLSLSLIAAQPAHARSLAETMVRPCPVTHTEPIRTNQVDALTPPLEQAGFYALPCCPEVSTFCRRRPILQVATEWHPAAVSGVFQETFHVPLQVSAPVPCHEFAAPPNIPIRAGPAGI